MDEVRTPLISRCRAAFQRHSRRARTARSRSRTRAQLINSPNVSLLEVAPATIGARNPSTTSSQQLVVSTSPAMLARLASLPRELRDKIFEFACYESDGFTSPQGAWVAGLGQEMELELREAYARETRNVFKADKATVAVSKQHNASWKRLNDCETGELRLHIELPYTPRPGRPSTWSHPKTSWIWRSAIPGRNAIRMTARPHHMARMQFIDWLDQHKMFVPHERMVFFNELRALLVDFTDQSWATCELLAPELKIEILEQCPDEIWVWCMGRH